MPISGATSVATTVYTVLDAYTNDYVYYKTDRYYATMEYGPGQPTIYYTRFVTRTYKNSNYTGQIGSAITSEYEGLNPL